MRFARGMAYLVSSHNVRHSISPPSGLTASEDAIGRLGTMPRRCPAAPERKKIGGPLRHLLYGSKPNIYRVVFEIDEPNKIVHVLTIRHGAMDESVATDL
jgi:toxin ParE1/3/4